MQKLEGEMRAFEESSDINKEEIERNEKELEEFEDQIQKDRNECLFFKNLGDKESQSKTISKTEAKVEAQKVREIAKESAGSKLRRNIYLGLMSLLTITDITYEVKEEVFDRLINAIAKRKDRRPYYGNIEYKDATYSVNKSESLTRAKLEEKVERQEEDSNVQDRGMNNYVRCFDDDLMESRIVVKTRVDGIFLILRCIYMTLCIMNILSYFLNI